MSNDKNAIIIALVNIKGGVGKSTTAIHIATELQALGYSTLLVDTDRQETTRFWYSQRQEKHPTKPTPTLMKPIENWKAGAYNTAILAQAKNYDFIVVDTAGFENGIMLEIMLSSHCVLIPSMVSQAEILSTASTIAKAQEEGITPLVLWSRIPPTTNQSKRLQECLDGMGAQAMQTVIYQRQAFIDAIEYGLVAAEIAVDLKQPRHKQRGAMQAGQEITQLIKELIALLKDK